KSKLQSSYFADSSKCNEKDHAMNMFKQEALSFIQAQENEVRSISSKAEKMRKRKIGDYETFVKNDPVFLKECKKNYKEKFSKQRIAQLRKSHENYFNNSGDNCDAKKAINDLTDDAIIERYCKDHAAIKADRILKFTNI